MANFTLDDVKTLRERLGTGMVDTKNALVEADGDLEKAVEILRLKGAKGNAKRGPHHLRGPRRRRRQRRRHRHPHRAPVRPTSSPRATSSSPSPTRCSPAVAARPNADALLAALGRRQDRGRAHRRGTRPSARRSSSACPPREGRTSFIYLHKTSKDLPPQVGVLVGDRGRRPHGARWRSTCSFSTPSSPVRGRRRVGRERARVVEASREEEGKPEAALPKIIEGHLDGYFKQIALLEQDYAKDQAVRRQGPLGGSGAKAQGFVRFRVGG